MQKLAIEQADENGFAKGMEKGLEQGLVQGIEKGMELGVEQGMETKAIEIARNLLDVLDNETIALKTGLSVDVVEGLR